MKTNPKDDVTAVASSFYRRKFIFKKQPLSPFTHLVDPDFMKYITVIVACNDRIKYITWFYSFTIWEKKNLLKCFWEFLFRILWVGESVRTFFSHANAPIGLWYFIIGCCFFDEQAVRMSKRRHWRALTKLSGLYILSGIEASFSFLYSLSLGACFH